MSLLWVFLCGLYHCPETIWSVPHSWNTSQSLSSTPTLFSPFPALKSPSFFLPLPSPQSPAPFPLPPRHSLEDPSPSSILLHRPPWSSWSAEGHLADCLHSKSVWRLHIDMSSSSKPTAGFPLKARVVLSITSRSERNKLSIKRSTGRHTKELNTVTSFVLCLSIRTPTSQLLAVPLFSEKGKADILKILLVINWPGLPLHP